MSVAFDRRKFLQSSVASTLAGYGSLATQAAAIEPIRRNGSAKFKFSLAAYSYRDLLSGATPQLTLADFVDDCANMELDGTELTSYYFPTPTTIAYLRELKQLCFKLGLDVSGTAVGNDFAFPAGKERDSQIDLVKEWIDRAEILGAPAIRIFAGKPKNGASSKESHSLMVAAIEECCDYAGQHGVFLALENHGGPTATPGGMLSFIRDVRSPWFGVNLDTGNFFSVDPYRDLEKIAPYALNVQVKAVMSHPEGQNKNPADFPRLASILRDAGYRGYIVLEFEEAGDPRIECPKYMSQLRKAFA